MQKVSQAVRCRAVIIFVVRSIRSPGSAAINMCLVACGSADAYYHMGIHCWDMAGGAAVVTEAGGVIMDISGVSLRKALQTVTVQRLLSPLKKRHREWVTEPLIWGDIVVLLHRAKHEERELFFQHTHKEAANDCELFIVDVFVFYPSPVELIWRTGLVVCT